MQCSEQQNTSAVAMKRCATASITNQQGVKNEKIVIEMRDERIKIRAGLFSLSVDIEGTIGVPEAEQFANEEERVATYEKFRTCLARIRESNARHIVVNIRSTGGDVEDALLIYEALRESGCKVTTRCYGYVASAATIIAQAASPGRRQIARSALYLVHRCHSLCEGNAEELKATRDMLEATDHRLATIYASRSGRSTDEMLALMSDNGGRGRWLSPEEAVSLGLADKVIGDRRGDKGGVAASVVLDESLPPLPAKQSEEVPGEVQGRGFMEARPTSVEAVEDPSPTERRLSANQVAYINDAQVISDR